MVFPINNPMFFNPPQNQSGNQTCHNVSMKSPSNKFIHQEFFICCSLYYRKLLHPQSPGNKRYIPLTILCFSVLPKLCPEIKRVIMVQCNPQIINSLPKLLLAYEYRKLVYPQSLGFHT